MNFVSPFIECSAELPRVHLQCLAGVHYNPVVELNPLPYNNEVVGDKVSLLETTECEENLRDTVENCTSEEVHLSMAWELELEEDGCP